MKARLGSVLISPKVVGFFAVTEKELFLGTKKITFDVIVLFHISQEQLRTLEKIFQTKFSNSSNRCKTCSFG